MDPLQQRFAVQALQQMTVEERLALYWLTKGLDQQEIAERIGHDQIRSIGISTIQNRINFGCKAFTGILNRPLEDIRDNVNIYLGEFLEAAIDPQSGGLHHEFITEIMAAFEAETEIRSTSRASSWLIYSLIALGIIFLLSNVAWYLWSRNLPRAITPAVIVETVTLAPTLSPPPPSTQKALVYTATPEPTPTPTTTISPLPTHTPSANILFEDNFADGLDPTWQLQSAPELVDDFLTTSNNAYWLYLPGDWKNYRITIKYANWCDTTFCISTFGLRAQNQANMVALMGGAGNSGIVGWNVVRNGQTTHIANSDFTYPLTEGEITFEVVGDDFLVVGYPKVHVSEFDSGGLYLQIRKNMKLYSVRVEEVP